MRTNFNIKNRAQTSRTLKKNFAVILIIVFFLVLLQLLTANPLGGIIHTLFRPVFIVENGVTKEVQEFLALVQSKRELARQNAKLKEQLDNLAPSAYLIDALRLENKELKTLLGRKESQNTILATILAKPPVSLYDTIILDVGLNKGVSIGDLVIVGNNFVVGDIAEVYEKSSLVHLFSTSGRETDITIGDERLLVRATGRGGGNFITTLPRGVEVKVGDIVILPNISAQIFGVVEHIVVTPADQFQTLLFNNPINSDKYIKKRLSI